MCRLIGLIANKEVDISFSMLEASNRFKNQGRTNPHGWGIGWYENGKVRIEKHGESAFHSRQFNELIKGIRSKMFIGHVRYASSGSVYSDKNAHPFGCKNWIFAHNGTINKSRIQNLLKSPYNIDFTSEPIDSEIYFRFILQNIEEKNDSLSGIETAVKEIVKDARGANFILSDGENIYAFKHGRELYFLIRDPKQSVYGISRETYALIESKRLANEKAVLIASEPVTKENWKELNDGDLLKVDKNLGVNRKGIL